MRFPAWISHQQLTPPSWFAPMGLGLTVEEARIRLATGAGTAEELAEANRVYYAWYGQQPSVVRARQQREDEEDWPVPATVSDLARLLGASVRTVVPRDWQGPLGKPVTTLLVFPSGQAVDALELLANVQQPDARVRATIRGYLGTSMWSVEEVARYEAAPAETPVGTARGRLPAGWEPPGTPTQALAPQPTPSTSQRLAEQARAGARAGATPEGQPEDWLGSVFAGIDAKWLLLAGAVVAFMFLKGK